MRIVYKKTAEINWVERGLFSPGKPAVCEDSRKVLGTGLLDGGCCWWG